MGIDFDAFMNTENYSKILSSIRCVDPSFSEEKMKPDFNLETILGWDSMNSINFCVSLEKEFGLPPESLFFQGGESLSDVIEEIARLKKGS